MGRDEEKTERTGVDAGETAAPKKKKRPAGDGAQAAPKKKKRPAEAGAEGAPKKKKKRPADADPVRKKKKRPATADADPVPKKKRPAKTAADDNAEPVRKKKKLRSGTDRFDDEPVSREETAGGRPKYVETVNADGVRERRTSTYSFLPDEPEPDLEALKKQREEEEQKELESGLLAEEELREGEHSEEERRAKRRAAKMRAARRRAAEQRRMQKIAIGAGCLVIALLLGLFILHKLSDRNDSADASGKAGNAQTEQTDGDTIDAIPADESVTAPAVITPEPVSTSITLTFTGDCTFGRDENFVYDTSFDAYYEENGYEYFFRNCKSIFEQDDLTVVNFEGTLTNADDSERLDKQFAFKADPEYVKIMSTTGVDAANVANNHSADYGEQSAEDTLKYLSEAGITPFGYSDSKVVDVKGVKVGLIGILELFEEMDCQHKMIEQIEAVKAQGAQIIVVTMHWGEEAQYYYDEDQYNLGRIAIDHGADLVIGHHPHRIQAIETYKGKNIVYSLANFCFGGNFEPSDMDSFIYQQTFTVNGGELVQDNVTKIIPISISSSSSYNNYQPTPYEDPDEIERIINKIKDLTTQPGVPVGGSSTGGQSSPENSTSAGSNDSGENTDSEAYSDGGEGTADE